MGLIDIVKSANKPLGEAGKLIFLGVTIVGILYSSILGLKIQDNINKERYYQDLYQRYVQRDALIKANNDVTSDKSYQP